MIKPESIPQYTGLLGNLDIEVPALATDATAIRTSGSDIHSRFQSLSAYYQAPEAEQLFATTLPVMTSADTVATEVETVARAVGQYRNEIRPLAAKLERLQREAVEFVLSVDGDDHWQEDSAKVDRNNQLRSDVDATVAAFQEAEVRAANTITALFSSHRYRVDDGSHKPYMYGYSADDLDHAKTPWGTPEEREYTGLAWLGHQVKSFVWDGFIVDGVWGTVHGLGTLVGTDGWDKAGQAWEGLAKVGTGLALSSPLTAPIYWTTPDSKLPSWIRDSRKALKDTGKALVAWDEWGKNPARAAGAVSFNVLTTVFTDGAGAATKTGVLAKTAAVAGKVGRVVDPMTHLITAGKFATLKIGDLATTMKGLRAADIPTGVRVLPDETIPLTTPHGATVHLRTRDGALLDDAGKVVNSGDDIPVEPSAADLDQATQHELASTGAHASNGSEHMGNGAAGGRPEGPTHLPSARHRATEVPHQPADPHSQSGAGSQLHGPGKAADSNPPSGDRHSHPDTNSSGDGGRLDHEGAASNGEPSDGMPHENGEEGDTIAERDPTELYTEGDRVVPEPTGGMHSGQEAALSEALDRSKMQAHDQQRLLTQLRKSPFGAGVADHISNGRLEHLSGYKDILSQCKQGNMIPSVYQAMEHAADLQSHGEKGLAFEHKVPADKLDLDVLTKTGEKIQYGWQLKDVQSVSGIKSAAKSIANKQLAGPGVESKVAIMYIHDTKSALTDEILKDIEHFSRKSNATFDLRFEDGSITVPANGKVAP
ncbi:hypothetical protein [Streptomyces sp. NBC_01500]|uniref:hypothetical protein n=1 Tax=Streptomyces sp. NBC_01500 TaxID=2903886 RepID=UPI002253AA76|nr:hypothetical protein [Streptomyces sp. NBC_01500]MCX4550041.1 hypothetical protein [Streptomyces sp. NBC_01500]